MRINIVVETMSKSNKFISYLFVATSASLYFAVILIITLYDLWELVFDNSLSAFIATLVFSVFAHFVSTLSWRASSHLRRPVPEADSNYSATNSARLCLPNHEVLASMVMILISLILIIAIGKSHDQSDSINKLPYHDHDVLLSKLFGVCMFGSTLSLLLALVWAVRSVASERLGSRQIK